LERTKNNKSLAAQIKSHSQKKVEPKEYDGDIDNVISTGSTLLNLAISGGRRRGGGIPGGVIVEIFGPPSIGKTSLICEVAGGVQREGGELRFYDPEGRLSSNFAKIFDLQLSKEEIKHPKTPLDIFPPLRDWQPKNPNLINGIFIDSIASLMSDLELENKKDEYSRVAKLFSQELRKSSIPIAEKKFIVMAANQLRQKVGMTGFGEKYDTPCGEAWKFYASLRLKATKANPYKLKQKITFRGKEIEEVIGTVLDIYVYKSSIWVGHHSATVYLLNDYGIDDIRANLMYLKQYGRKAKKPDGTDYSGYSLNGDKLGVGIDDALSIIEKDRRFLELKEAVIDLWEEIQVHFKVTRKKER